MVELCPTCNRPVPEHTTERLSRTKELIYQFINRHPDCSASDVWNHIYGHDANGGPNTMNIVSVHVSQINKVIAPLGLKIKSTMGPGATYSVRKVSE